VFEGQPRLVLGLFSFRVRNVAYVHQTVTAILILAALILLLSCYDREYWIAASTEGQSYESNMKSKTRRDVSNKRFRHVGRGPPQPERIFQILAPDEIGDRGGRLNSQDGRAAACVG